MSDFKGLYFDSEDRALGGALILPIARRVGRSLDHLHVDPEVDARDREATTLALASAALGELTGRRDVREGRRQMVLSLPGARQAGRHDRFLSVADVEHGGGETFSRQGPQGLKDCEQSPVINTDKAPIYAAALADLKAEGKCPTDTQHRQVKYLNNIVRSDLRQAQTGDPPGARFQNGGDGLCDDQRL